MKEYIFILALLCLFSCKTVIEKTDVFIPIEVHYDQKEYKTGVVFEPNGEKKDLYQTAIYFPYVQGQGGVQHIFGNSIDRIVEFSAILKEGERYYYDNGNSFSWKVQIENNIGVIYRLTSLEGWAIVRYTKK